MGSKSSKASEVATLTTTMKTTMTMRTTTMKTTTVLPTFPCPTTTVSDCTEKCECHIEVVLAFFGGILLALLICAIFFCVNKIKDKVKSQSGHSRNRRKEQESSHGVGGHPLETIDEEVSYATLRFVKT